MRKILLSMATLAWMAAAMAAEPPIVGVSNGWVGSEWRTQMVDDVKKVFDEYKAKGLVKDLIVQSTDVSVEGQIDQIRNLMSQGCKIILVNPNDAKAFSPVAAEAKKRGVIILGTDTELASKDVYNVCIDQKKWAEISSDWLCQRMGGKGNIAFINGFAGHPGNTTRVEAYRGIMKKYPDVKIVAEVNGDWDNAKGLAAAQSIISAHPDLTAIWAQDGMTDGVFTAIRNSGRDVMANGEARVGFLRTWKQNNLDTIGVANPPGCLASGLKIGLRLYEGKKLKKSALSGPYGNSIYVPIPVVVTKENFDTVFDEYKDKPDYFAVDGIITEEQADAFFE